MCKHKWAIVWELRVSSYSMSDGGIGWLIVHYGIVVIAQWVEHDGIVG